MRGGGAQGALTGAGQLHAAFELFDGVFQRELALFHFLDQRFEFAHRRFEIDGFFHWLFVCHALAPFNRSRLVAGT